MKLTRRKLLGAVSAIGLASVWSGLGSTAMLGDSERVTDNSVTTGSLNMTVTAEILAASEYYTSDGAGPDIIGDVRIADESAVVGLQAGDVKPGDWVIIRFEVSVADDPGYVRVSAADFAQYENGRTEPEADVDETDGGSLGRPFDGQGSGELQDELVAEVYDTFDASVSSEAPRDYLGGLRPNLSGSAQAAVEQFATGVVVGGGATPTEVGSGADSVERYLLLELPRAVGNTVQSDSIAFDVVFDGVQSSENEGFTPSSDLVGYWPLNSVDDGTVEDLSGNGNDGTVVGDVSAVAGQVAGGGSFDGSGDYVEIADDASLGVTSVTVSAWVYRDGSKNLVYVVDGRDHNYFIKFDDGTSTPRFGVRVGGSFEILNAGSGDIPDRTWTHVAGTYDGSELTIFVNGAEAGTKSASGGIDVSAGPARIGDYIGGGYAFPGLIDDVRIYGRALADSEVQHIYDATK